MMGHHRGDSPAVFRTGGAPFGGPMEKSVHYVITSTATNLKQWPDGRDRCIFCGKDYTEGEWKEEEFCRVLNAKNNWEFARQYKTSFCREDNEIMALWVMAE
jgi:hypothetical protein